MAKPPNDKKPVESKPRQPRWIRRRQIPVPTWRGWLLLLIVFGMGLYIALHATYPFLAVNDPLPGGYLVVEGWAPDYALRAAVAEFRSNRYEKIYVTGGPIEQGSFLVPYKTAAELGMASLCELGVKTNEIQAIPAPWVSQDRTYTAAASLKMWFTEHVPAPDHINLLTVGPHARRSRLLYQQALGHDIKVGIVSLPGGDYDTGRWWRSSQGFRIVTGEVIAYIYAKLLFRPATTCTNAAHGTNSSP